MWLFFDVGSTILDEKSLEDLRVKILAKEFSRRGIKVSQRLLTQTMENLVTEYSFRRGYDLTWEACYRLSTLKEAEVIMENFSYKFTAICKRKLRDRSIETLVRPYPDVWTAIPVLARRHNLGLIGNQPSEIETHLKHTWKLSEYFKVIAISERVQLRKPDRALFVYALAKAAADPAESVMIGDRLDTDIAPAKSLGMTTVRILRGMMRLQRAYGELEKPNYEIKTLKNLLKLF